MRSINFISGHLDLTAAEFEEHYRLEIDLALARGDGFVVSDARGADTMAQTYLLGKTEAVVVYHMLDSPRNNCGFPTVGGFESDDARDCRLSADSVGVASPLANRDIAWVRPGRERSGPQQNLDRRKLRN